MTPSLHRTKALMVQPMVTVEGTSVHFTSLLGKEPPVLWHTFVYYTSPRFSVLLACPMDKAAHLRYL
jgi:hypothetical protein